MELTQKTRGDLKLELKVKARAEEVDRAFSDAEAMFAQQMGLAPLEGKSIAQLAEDSLNIANLDTVLAPSVFELLIPRAIDQANLNPAFLPQPNSSDGLARGADFSFSFELSLKPDYELSSYGPVAISVPPLFLDEREVDAEIAQIADSYASFIPDDPRPVGEGDCFSVSLACSENGKEIPHLNFEERTYIMGMGLMPTSFDDNLLGMHVGETKSFNFSLPAPAGQEEQLVDCRVTINEMQKKVIPAITDTWLSQHMPSYVHVDALKDAIRESLNAAKKVEHDNLIRQRATAELSTRFEGKIEDEVYEATRDSFLMNLQAQVAQQGMDFDQFMAQSGGEQQFSMMLMMQVRQSLVEGYALDALYRHEQMDLEEEDIYDACREINPQDPRSVREQMEHAGYGYALRESAQRYKAGQWLVDHAEITIDGQTSKGV